MRHRDSGKVVPGGTLHGAPAHIPSEGAGTKHAGFLLHLSRREHGTQECTVRGAVKGLWASPASPMSLSGYHCPDRGYSPFPALPDSHVKLFAQQRGC